MHLPVILLCFMASTKNENFLQVSSRSYKLQYVVISNNSNNTTQIKQNTVQSKILFYSPLIKCIQFPEINRTKNTALYFV